MAGGRFLIRFQWVRYPCGSGRLRIWFSPSSGSGIQSPGFEVKPSSLVSGFTLQHQQKYKAMAGSAKHTHADTYKPHFSLHKQILSSHLSFRGYV